MEDPLSQNQSHINNTTIPVSIYYHILLSDLVVLCHTACVMGLGGDLSLL